MTDKEQIMIDGIQFNKFGDFYVDYDLSGKFQSISSSAKEYKILKSLIKQLSRKTQECEKLKEKNALLESQMAFNLSEVEIKLGNEINRSETLLKELKRFDKIKDEFREMSEKLKPKTPATARLWRRLSKN